MSARRKHIERSSIMTKLLNVVFAAAFAFGLNSALAQNVKSDQDKAQGQEQKMQEKEKGTSGAGQQTNQGDRERAKSDDNRSAPSAGGPTSADKAQSAMNCDGKSGHDKEECLEHAQGKPADADDAGAAGDDKYKRKTQ
jgi:hypothetical protein